MERNDSPCCSREIQESRCDTAIPMLEETANATFAPKTSRSSKPATVPVAPLPPAPLAAVPLAVDCTPCLLISRPSSRSDRAPLCLVGVPARTSTNSIIARNVAR